MTTKTERIAIRVDSKTKKKIENLAKKENRSMSNFIENIIIEKLEEKDMTINNDVRYYEDIMEKSGGKWNSYTNLYDEDFNLIRSVKVQERVVLEGITRIVKETDKDNIALLAYNLTDLGNGFYKVEKDEDTKETLEAIAKNIK